MINRKSKITPKKIAAVLVPLLIVLVIVLTYLFSGKEPGDIINIAQPKKKKPVINSQFTGEPTTGEIKNRRPVAVIIENSPRARPQTGLSKADWVFEVVAEGGITRMMAFVHDKEADRLGPIRSVRQYFASIAKSIDAVLIHAGGSPGGYKALDDLFVTHVDQIKESKPFWRSKERRAPHNLYSSTKSLRDYIREKGYEREPVAPGYSFVKLKPDLTPEVKEVSVNYSSAPYKVVFSYDTVSGLYKRALAGKADIDSLTGQQITAANIAVMVADIESTNDEKGRVKVQTEGSGSLFLFTGGKLKKGQWIRPDVTSSYKLIDESGRAIKLSKGTTWFSIVSSEQKIGYQVLTPPKKSGNGSVRGTGVN